MLFLISWTAGPECRDAAIERFVLGGADSPPGVQLLGRWHAVGPIAGFAIAEASESAAIMRWVNGWSDLFAISVHPAVSDAELRQVALQGSHAALADGAAPIELPRGFPPVRSAARDGDVRAAGG